MSDETKPKAKRRPPIPLLILAVGLVIYGGYRVYLERKPYEWSGTVEARTISVGSRAGGRIAQVLVREGDAVQAGQALLQLEPGDFPAQLLQATAQEASAQAVLDKLRKGARPEELAQARARTLTAQAALQQAMAGARPEQVQAAESRLAAQEIAVQKTKADAAREHQLDDSGAAAHADLENADLAVQQALAQRAAAKWSKPRR